MMLGSATWSLYRPYMGLEEKHTALRERHLAMKLISKNRPQLNLLGQSSSRTLCEYQRPWSNLWGLSAQELLKCPMSYASKIGETRSLQRSCG